MLFELNQFTPDVSGVFKLTERLESTVLQRMLTISLSWKLDLSIKEKIQSKKFSFFIHAHPGALLPSSRLSNSKDS